MQMMAPRLALLAGCAALLGLAACSGQDADGRPQAKSGETVGTVSFAADIQPLFDTQCVQCHALELPQAGLVLEEGMALPMLAEAAGEQSAMPRVTPGSPERSYLLHKLKGTHLEQGGSGLGMPLTEGAFTPLREQDIALIETWIREGANDN